MAKNRFPMGGMGGANFNQMMKQAQKMQQDMIKMQEELDTLTCEASAGGGMVTVTANAKKEIKVNSKIIKIFFCLIFDIYTPLCRFLLKIV